MEEVPLEKRDEETQIHEVKMEDGVPFEK